MFSTIFNKVTPYNLRNTTRLEMQKVHSVYYANEALSQLEPKLCSLVPHGIKQSVPRGDFKSKITNRLQLIVPAGYSKPICIK